MELHGIAVEKEKKTLEGGKKDFQHKVKGWIVRQQSTVLETMYFK